MSPLSQDTSEPRPQRSMKKMSAFSSLYDSDEDNNDYDELEEDEFCGSQEATVFNAEAHVKFFEDTFDIYGLNLND